MSLWLAACVMPSPAGVGETSLPTAESDALGSVSEPAGPQDGAGDTTRGGAVEAFCVRPDRGDALFTLNRWGVDRAADALDRRSVYRTTYGPEGFSEESSTFFDVHDHYPAADVVIQDIICHAVRDEVLVVVKNLRAFDSGNWWAELWHLDGDGQPILTSAFARDLGAKQVAWSPDGTALLLEGSPFGDAGAVYWLDLESKRSGLLAQVALWTPAGAGGGWLRWSHDGRYAYVDSLVSERSDPNLPWVTKHSFETVDMTTSVPSFIGSRDLQDVLTSATSPGGIVYLASEHIADDRRSQHLELRRWDPAQLTIDPELLAEFELPSERPDLTFGLAVLPGSSSENYRRGRPATLRAVFTARAREAYALYLLEVDSRDESRLTRLTPVGTSCTDYQIAGEVLAYLLKPPLDAVEKLSSESLDLAAQLVIVPLSELRD